MINAQTLLTQKNGHCRDCFGLVLTHINDINTISFFTALLIFNLLTFSYLPALVTIFSVLADVLKTLFEYMLSDRSYKVFGIKDLKVSFGVVIQLATVEDCAGLLMIGDLIHRKRITHDVAGKIIKTLPIIRSNSITVMNPKNTVL